MPVIHILVESPVRTRPATGNGQVIHALDALVHHFGHQRGLLRHKRRADHVHGIQVALPHLPARRGTVAQVHRRAVAVAQVPGKLHRVPGLGGEAHARELDIVKVAQLVARAIAAAPRLVQRGIVGLPGKVEKQRRHTVVITVMEQADLGVLRQPVTRAQPPLAAVARLDRATVADRCAVGQIVDDARRQAEELRPRAKGVAAKIVTHRVELGFFPFVLVEAEQGQILIDRPRTRYLPHRQVGILGFGTWYVELGRVHRCLALADVGPEQALAPCHQMPPGLERQVLVIIDGKVAIHISIQQPRLAAAEFACVPAEVVVAPGLVHRVRRVVVVALMVDLVIEMTGAHHRTEVVVLEHQFAEYADPIVDQ